MDYNAFKKWVTKKGYRIKPTSKHHKLVDSNGNTVVRFPINHGKGQKKTILPVHIQNIKKIIGE